MQKEKREPESPRHHTPLEEDITMPRKVLIALKPAMLEQIDFIAQCEHRTRSDLIREALRRYLESFRDNHASVRLPRDP